MGGPDGAGASVLLGPDLHSDAGGVDPGAIDADGRGLGLAGLLGHVGSSHATGRCGGRGFSRSRRPARPSCAAPRPRRTGSAGTGASQQADDRSLLSGVSRRRGRRPAPDALAGAPRVARNRWSGAEGVGFGPGLAVAGRRGDEERRGNGAAAAVLAAYMTTIGLIGSGHIGSTVARLAVDAGHDVVLSNSRGPDTLTDLVDQLGPHARAATAAEAAAAGDLVVVTVPLKAYTSVPVEPLAGKIVLDTNNYYPQRDGHIAELDDESTTTSELLARQLPGAKVVKAFNHIGAADIVDAG